MKKKTKELISTLRELAGKANECLYGRARIASMVLADLDYIAEVHGGNEDRAIESLQSEFFQDVCSYIPLGKVRLIYEMFPDPRTWADHNYNLNVMEQMLDEQLSVERTSPQRRTRWKSVAASLEDELAIAKRKIKELTEENQRLNRRVWELEKLEDVEK